MDIRAEKDAQRQALRKARAQMPAHERARVDGGICSRVTGLAAFRGCDLLLSYLAFGSEVETRGIIRAAWQAGRGVALPRCVPGTRLLSWHYVSSLEQLTKNPMGMLEPDEGLAQVAPSGITGRTLALVPGIAFDEKGFRMGYGGGYYDVFLSSFPGTSLGLCREEQLCREGLVREPHDLPVSCVVTEMRCIQTNTR